jgi:hypothetical protein
VVLDVVGSGGVVVGRGCRFEGFSYLWLAIGMEGEFEGSCCHVRGGEVFVVESQLMFSSTVVASKGPLLGS